MNPEREIDLKRLVEEVYRIKLNDAGLKTDYQEMEGIDFDCERIPLKETVQLSTDQLLDLYNDYMTLYNITKEPKFQAKAMTYKNQFNRKVKVKRQKESEVN